MQQLIDREKLKELRLKYPCATLQHFANHFGVSCLLYIDNLTFFILPH